MGLMNHLHLGLELEMNLKILAGPLEFVSLVLKLPHSAAQAYLDH